MAQMFEIPSGPDKQFISALYQEAKEATTPDRDKILVIMLHGFPGMHKQSHADLYGDLEFLFSSSGFHSFRFDFRCCGSSEGLQEDFTLKTAAEDMDAILDWAYKQGFEQIIYVAEGIGAAFCMPKINKTTRTAIWFWPVLDLNAYASRHFIVDGLQENETRTTSILVKDNRIGVDMVRQMKETDYSSALEKIECPILIQYGASDDKVDEKQIDFIRQHAKSRRIDITGYQDGNHGLTDERHRKMVFYHIGQFLSKYI